MSATSFEKISFIEAVKIVADFIGYDLTGYEVSGAMVDVRYIIKDEGMRYDIYSPAKKITARILLPDGKVCRTLLINGQNSDFVTETVGESNYVCFSCNPDKKISFEIIF